jgi:hypothetical protein
MGSVNVFYKDKIMNPFIGAGALASVIDEFTATIFITRASASSAAAISRR